MQVHRDDPVIVIQLGRAGDPADAFERPAAALEAAIAQPRFAVMLRTSASGARTPEAVRQRWRAWLDAHAARFESGCAAVAVVAASQLRALPFRLATPILRRMFHAPARVFTDDAAARAWLASYWKT